MKRAPSCVGIPTLILALAAPVHLPAAGAARRRIALAPGERVFSGAVKQGHLMPLAAPYRLDFYATNDSNQIQPLVLGTRELWIWSEEPFAFEVTADAVLVDDPAGTARSGRRGTTLAEARRHAAAFFPASGKMPDPLLFERPQYNTWIELTFDQSQSSLEYVFPNEGLEDVKDEFPLGADLLVAPMVEKGTRRTVRLPKGRWVADDGREYSGGAHVIDVPLERLPRFRRVGR